MARYASCWRTSFYVLFTSDGEGKCDCRRLSVCLPVCLLARLLKNVWIWMKFCVSTDIGTWTNWLTFEPDPDHSPDSGTGFISRISCTLQNFAALLSLAYFSAISVSFCAKLARSILMRDRNTATESDFRLSLSKCRILSPKNSWRFRTCKAATQLCC